MKLPDTAMNDTSFDPFRSPLTLVRFLIAGLAGGAGLLLAQQPSAPSLDPGPPPATLPPTPPLVVTAPFNEALPGSGRIAAGQGLVLDVISTFPTGTTYQWYKDGLPVPGRTGLATAWPSFSAADAGDYQVAVTSGGNTILSEQRAFTVSPPSRFSNLSTRAASGGDRGVLTSGFVITGAGSKTMLQRAAAPVLARAPFHVVGTMSDPAMTLFSAGTTLATWDNWRDFPEQERLSEATAAVGAFPFDPAETRDAAAIHDYSAGVYTLEVRESSGGAGIALLELYDASLADSATQLVNISTRSFVGTGDDVLITGFVIDGEAPQTVLARAVGPTLAEFGVPGVLADPKFTLMRGNEAVGGNDDWGRFNDVAGLVARSREIGAFDLAPASRDAAAVFTLLPGAYTIVVEGADQTVGQVLVELYRLDG